SLRLRQAPGIARRIAAYREPVLPLAGALPFQPSAPDNDRHELRQGTEPALLLTHWGPGLGIVMVTKRRRLAIDRIDQWLADAPLHLAMHRQQRFSPGGLFLGSQRIDVRPARRLDLGDALFVVLQREVVLIVACLAHGALEQGADIGRQRIPEFLVDDDGIAVVAMVRQ